MQALHVRSLSFNFPAGGTVLRGIDAECSSGKVMGILGPNGAGKSTLLRLMLGSILPTQGTVLLDGAPADSWQGEDLARRAAFVAQRSGVIGTSSGDFLLRELLALGARFATTNDRERAIAQAVERFDLGQIIDRAEGALSAGEQQRGALARAWVQLAVSRHPCRVLLADEPTSALDPAHALGVLQELRSCARDSGMCVVVVLHDLNLASRLTDECLVVNKDGSPGYVGDTPGALNQDVLRGVFGVDFTTFEGPEGKCLLPGRAVTAKP